MTSQKPHTSFLPHYVRGEMQFGAWGLVGQGVSALNSLIILSALSLYEYGVFQLLLAVLALVLDLPSVALAFVEADLPRYIGEGKERQAKRLFLEFYGFWLVISLIIAVLLFFVSDIFVPKYGPDVARFGKIFALLLLADVLTRMSRALLKLRLRFGVVASRRTFQKLVQLAVLGTLSITAAKIDIHAILWSMVAGTFGANIFMLPAMVRAYAPWRTIRATERFLLLRTFRVYGKWAVMRRFLGQATEQVQPWLVKFFVSTEAVALFVVARSLIAAVTNLMPTRTLDVLLPMSIADREHSRRIFLRGVKFHVALTFLGSFFGLIFIPPAVRVLFPKYIAALPYFYALLGTAPIAAIGGVPSLFLRALRRQKFLFFHRAIKTAIIIPLMLILLPLFGLWGMVIERWIQLLVLVSVLLFYLSRHCPQCALRLEDLVRLSADDVLFARQMARTAFGVVRGYYRVARRALP